MNSYEIFENETVNPSNDIFVLHSHNNYEILLLLEGSVDYVIEGKHYILSPGDIMLIRKHQLHRPYHSAPSIYKRIVVNIYPDFFIENNCPEFEEQFINESLNLDNKISASVVKKSGIYDAFMRLEKYSNNFTKPQSPVYISSLMEILYLLNDLDTFSKADTVNPHFTKVIDHINEHFCENLSLDILSETFFMSKYRLCHLFKERTGLTFRQYLNKKRFAKLQELVNEGISITDASIMVGFMSYASFYRTYVKEFGLKPKDGLK